MASKKRGLGGSPRDTKRAKGSRPSSRKTTITTKPEDKPSKRPTGIPTLPIRGSIPAAAPTLRMLDDLAQTVEAPTFAPQSIILDAAEAVIDRVGFEQATDDLIASEAGISLDVLRANFESPKDLLAALNVRFCDQVVALTNDATKSGVWEHATARDVIEIAVRSTLDVVFGRAALIRAVFASGEPSMLAEYRRVGQNLTKNITRVIGETRGPKGDKLAPRDVAFALLQTIGLAHHVILIGTEWSGLDYEREDLTARAVRAATVSLGLAPKAPLES